jgi:hypothetical protein
MKYPLNISKEDSTYILLGKIFNIIGSQKVKKLYGFKAVGNLSKIYRILRLIAVSFLLNTRKKIYKGVSCLCVVLY